MIPATQREALNVLTELCDLSQDVRLRQVLELLGLLSEDETGRNLWDIDDEYFLAILIRIRVSSRPGSPIRQSQKTSLPRIFRCATIQAKPTRSHQNRLALHINLGVGHRLRRRGGTRRGGSIAAADRRVGRALLRGVGRRARCRLARSGRWFRG